MFLSYSYLRLISKGVISPFLKMTSHSTCFSSPGQYALPPIFLLSVIPGLHKNIQGVKPEVKIVNIDLSCFESDLGQDQLNEMKDAEILICDGDLLAKYHKYMPNLKWAHCTWAGIDPVMAAIPEEPQFKLTRHGGPEFSNLMAEYVMWQILSNERSSKSLFEIQKAKVWKPPESKCRSLDELKIAILGLGQMGSSIAALLRQRSSTVHGFTRKSEQHQCEKISHNIEDVICDCDYLVNALPSTPTTRGLLNECILSKCNKKPFFINVGRGDIIDESELVKVLKKGILSGAALDVFEVEPLPVSSELWEMEQVTITFHRAAVSYPDHVSKHFYRLLEEYVDNGHLPYVNWNAGY